MRRFHWFSIIFSIKWKSWENKWLTRSRNKGTSRILYEGYFVLNTHRKRRSFSPDSFSRVAYWNELVHVCVCSHFIRVPRAVWKKEFIWRKPRREVKEFRTLWVWHPCGLCHLCLLFFSLHVWGVTVVWTHASTCITAELCWEGLVCCDKQTHTTQVYWKNLGKIWISRKIVHSIISVLLYHNMS